MNVDPATLKRGKVRLEDVVELLLDRGVISGNTARQISESINPASDRHVFAQVGELGLRDSSHPRIVLDTEMITRLFADECGIPYFRIDPLKVDVEAITGLVSQAYATRFQFLPVVVTESFVTIASSEPYHREWETELAPILEKEIRTVLANPLDIEKYLKEFYGVSRSLLGAANKADNEKTVGLGDFEQLTELGSIGELDANDQHVVHLTDWVLQYAFEQRASDIHIEPRRDEGNVRFRIDGVLHLVHRLAAPVLTAITSRLKSLGRMDVADKRRPQDGRIKMKTPAALEVELRLSTMPTTFGEKLVLRIFDPEKLTQPFASLGFSDQDQSLWENMARHTHGIILVTGPTGSGKTTTLYSALKQLARPEINVCTIEDPIEMVEPAFNQMQAQSAIDLDFAAGVRTLLRQDPDVIMIGEIRDRETADVAVQAALTGHLVLSTLHTNDATSAVTRLIDIGVASYLINATLLGVIAQRLVRTLCHHCKQAVTHEPTAWRSLAGARQDFACDFHVPVGCDECRNTGYKGREGVFEILTITESMGEIIRPDTSAAALRRHALRGGMRTLREAGAEKIALGRTTLEEVLSVVPQTDLTIEP